MTLTARGLHRGRVVDFDAAVGLGVVVEEASAARFTFHCTQIAGASRTIDAGQTVTFSVLPGRGGRWEAGRVTPA